MRTLVVHPLGKKPLVGSVPVPGDRSIGHRALLFSALCEGDSELRGFSRSDETLATANALRAMGARIEEAGTTLTVRGCGLFGLRAPSGALDCGSSGTTMLLLAGLLAGQRFRATLIGDAALSMAPMLSVVAPLRERGAVIEGTARPTGGDELTPPLTVGPLPEAKELGELELRLPVADADVKSALLLSGLYAHGTTWLDEPMLSRDHTERMMHALDIPLRAVGTAIELDPAGWSGKIPGLSLDVPGDASAAAYLIAAAAITEGSRVTVRGVGVNPTRMGLIEIARHMGAGVEVVPQGEQAGEPVGEITTWQQPLAGDLIAGELVPRAIDEIPIACALAARAAGETTIRDVGSLGTMVEVLRAFGVACEALPDGIVIQGTTDLLGPAAVESRGDHRIAMTAAVLGLHASAPTRIIDCDCIAAGFPRFVGTLRALGARIDVE